MLGEKGVYYAFTLRLGIPAIAHLEYLAGVFVNPKRLEDMSQLQLSFLLAYPIMMCWQYTQNINDLPLTLLIIRQLIFLCNLQQRPLNQLLHILLFMHLQLLQHILIINYTLNHLKLSPLNQYLPVFY